MSIKKSHLTALGVRDADADKYLSDLNQLMQEYQIDTELRIAHFLAQVLGIDAVAEQGQGAVRAANRVAKRMPHRLSSRARSSPIFWPKCCMNLSI